MGLRNDSSRRTREEHGELFRVSDQHNREYGILEIQDSRLRFRYNLNSLRTEEKEIWLSAIYVDDGQWHTAKVSRYGSAAILTLDGGEGRRYNDTFVFRGHQVSNDLPTLRNQLKNNYQTCQ